MAPPYTVAIVGAGPQGLGALKNLLEESEDGRVFQPTILEARERLGGLWAYSADPTDITVLESTLGNVSRFRNCYGDFPVMDEDGGWDENGTYQRQPGFLQYLERYASSFGLEKYIKYNTMVTGIRRVDERDQWELTVTKHNQEQKMLFDKVIIATGLHSTPVVPSIPGQDLFTGPVVHSSLFKRPSSFNGQRVLVLGLGSTAADITGELIQHASEVLLSHRHGNHILPRIFQGTPIDILTSRRVLGIRTTMASWAPTVANKKGTEAVKQMTCTAFDIDAKWGFDPKPPILMASPVISDTLVPNLAAGSITSVAAVRGVNGPKSVQFEDGTTREVDAIVLCTGYSADYSLMRMSGVVDFFPPLQAGLNAAASAHHVPDAEVPRLYQNMFPPSHSDSLVFLNNWKLNHGICEVSDLVTMALAQIWKGAYTLPSKAEMERTIDAHRQWCLAVTGGLGGAPKMVAEGPWRTWLHDAAGTGVNENLGWGWQGWWFWLRQREFCQLLMSGVDSPHLSRLFDGRRKKWEGAKEAILEANRLAEEKFPKAKKEEIMKAKKME